MTVTLVHKRSSTPGDIPTAAQLVPGELAINTADGILFTEKADGSVVAFTPSVGKNRIINGGMAISQRGASISCPPNVFTYTLDRWVAGVTGATMLVTQGTASTYPYTYIATYGAVGNTGISFRQRIEALNCRDLAGKVVTLSFFFYDILSTASKKLTVQYANALNDFSAVTTIINGQVLPSTGGRQSVTFTVPAGAVNGIEVMFLGENHTNNANPLILYDVQLEEGPIATPFERRQIGEEVLLCQGYFQRIHLSGLASALAATTAGVTLNHAYPTSMRATPTLINPFITDANYSTSGSPPAGTYSFHVPGVLACTKTGTMTISVGGNHEVLSILFYGMTLSAVPTTLVCGSGVYLDASAEL